MATPDLVRRDFTATRPDALWLADFTYIRTWEGWAYLAVVLDVYTRRIVGWQLAPHMRQSLVTDAFEMALAARQEHDGDHVAHSDNGSQYTSYEYTERLVRAGIAPSRGRTGTALDNAMAESVISTLKRELVSRYRWPTRLDLELALRHLHRLVQRPPPAPLTQAKEQRADPSAGTAADPRAVQSAGFSELGSQVTRADAEPGACHPFGAALLCLGDRGRVGCTMAYAESMIPAGAAGEGLAVVPYRLSAQRGARAHRSSWRGERPCRR